MWGMVGALSMARLLGRVLVLPDLTPSQFSGMMVRTTPPARPGIIGPLPLFSLTSRGGEHTTGAGGPNTGDYHLEAV